jgi:hypothetical protein
MGITDFDGEMNQRHVWSEVGIENARSITSLPHIDICAVVLIGNAHIIILWSTIKFVRQEELEKTNDLLHILERGLCCYQFKTVNEKHQYIFVQVLQVMGLGQGCSNSRAP